MEPFTLIIWLMRGEVFEETRVENLGRGECVELSMQIGGDRGKARGQCISANGRDILEIKPPLLCAPGGGSCAWPLLPGRKRV